MQDIIIKPEQLNALLHDTNIRIIDIGKADRFAAMHIPYALHVDSTILQHEQQPFGLMPSVTTLNNLFNSIGHNNNVTYVVYDDDLGSLSGRFIWILDSINHRKYKYLDGGLKYWLQSGMPVSKTIHTVAPTSNNIQINQDFTISATELLSTLNNKNYVLWDVRSIEEFKGTTKYANRGGHIPGAINFEWLNLVDTNLMLRQDMLELLKSIGVYTDNELIVYCQTHRRSGLAYLVANMFGLKVKAYAGSWGQWGNDKDLPVGL